MEGVYNYKTGIWDTIVTPEPKQVQPKKKRAKMKMTPTNEKELEHVVSNEAGE